MKFLARFLYSGFGSGFSPIMPGTCGTVAAFLLYCLEFVCFPGYYRQINAAIFFLLIIPAVKLGDFAEKDFGRKDPQAVVLDEFFGFFLSVLFIPFSMKNALIAFVLFRIFDILKPFPINRVQKLKGGLGIFMDDIIAGLMANVIIWIAIYAGLL